jgi:dolichyl-phosphate-mannose-protein mannosyltransferase
MTSNNALIPDPDKEDILASKPLDWPFLHLGLRMCGWGDNQIKYYLMGNPIIWWGGTLSILAFPLVVGLYLMRQQRRYQDMDPSEYPDSADMDLSQLSPGEWNQFLYVGKVALFGWGLHFRRPLYCIFGRSRILRLIFIPLVPFLVMGRVTYVHHYVSPRVSHSGTSTLICCVASCSLLLHAHGRPPHRPLCFRFATH